MAHEDNKVTTITIPPKILTLVEKDREAPSARRTKAQKRRRQIHIDWRPFAWVAKRGVKIHTPFLLKNPRRSMTTKREAI